MFNRVASVIWLIVFSMLLVLSIQKGEVIWIITESLVIFLNALAIVFPNKKEK
ncbi:hypothetical protein ORN01_25170 [Bacillus cereus]|uniref:hypothetical protein n=1 Tax=Bacillus cereus TaxID=1396 RepID=UPI002AC23AB5|nr:hypothetical protein [Bacillus cereus]MDZ4632250.1 hypothetical protein [Bacillus cereus]